MTERFHQSQNAQTLVHRYNLPPSREASLLRTKVPLLEIGGQKPTIAPGPRTPRSKDVKTIWRRLSTRWVSKVSCIKRMHLQPEKVLLETMNTKQDISSMLDQCLSSLSRAEMIQSSRWGLSSKRTLAMMAFYLTLKAKSLLYTRPATLRRCVLATMGSPSITLSSSRGPWKLRKDPL